MLQGHSSGSSPLSSKISAVSTTSSEQLTKLLAEREQTIEKLAEEIKQLQTKASGDAEVGGPCVEHIQSKVN